MADGEATLGQRFKRFFRVRRTGAANFANPVATSLVILAAFFGIASIFVGSELDVGMIATAMLLVVVAYFFYLVAAFALPHDHDHRFRHVVYQSAAFIVLALSLRAFGLHEAVVEVRNAIIGAVTRATTPDAAMNTKSVGELAAVMILFILVEIAAFVAQDVDEARAQVKKAGDGVKELATGMEATAQALGHTMREMSHVQLVTSVAQLDPSVMTEAIAMAQLWAKRAPNLGGAKPTMAQRCWRVLLQTYLKEEQHDFWPKGRTSDPLEGVPPCVRPVGGGVADEHISYFATNVGFYVRYLAKLVHELQTNKDDNQKVCIAVVTNVLPAHWWNWTFSANEWRAYTAMEYLRTEMRNIARRGAQVDRVIAVAPSKPEDAVPYDRNELGLWPQVLLYDMLANWQILLPEDSAKASIQTVNCSEDFQASRGTIGTSAFSMFPSPLKNGALLKSTSGARIYPMISTPTTEIYQTMSRKWRPEPLWKAYQEIQGRGRYWPLPVTSQVALDLDEHFDVMFIGIGPEDAGSDESGVWDAEHVDWGVCLMNSYSAAVETMFLSVISHEGAADQYKWWRTRLHEDTVPWGAVLPNAAEEWKAAQSGAVGSP